MLLLGQSLLLVAIFLTLIIMFVLKEKERYEKEYLPELILLAVVLGLVITGTVLTSI